jgi:hypothetical protein
MSLHTMMTDKNHYLGNTCRESWKSCNCGARLLCYYKFSIQHAALSRKSFKKEAED